MEVHVSIGKTHSFELHDALLIYKGGQQSFVTHHSIIRQDGAVPTLGPAQPLTVTFLDSLLRSLRRNTDTEVLPENVLARGDQSLTWWTPRGARQMFYRSADGKCVELNGRIFPVPPLVWQVSRGSLAVRALLENKRPGAKTKLAFAPFWNISNNGTVCLGSMRHPDAASIAAMADWEQGFYESAFTHSNVARITRHPGGFEKMWAELAGKRKSFPSEHLIQMPETLADFVRGRRDM
jgi:PRTRC genetic system protein B